ncbi:BCAS3 microtubule associated cell migration factor-like [Macrobrachium nipponense]|uniref:BCAS3 microtubule associated cell migration factor-like n=1 Tax=Macrobrachium nipponense TaxID=159736 RepID=UPI0030C82C70
MSSAMSGETWPKLTTICGPTSASRTCDREDFVENVAGFINEVVPQTYSNPSHYEGKETISWVRFDHCDINDLAQFRDKIEVNGNSPPLLLIVGYACGVQVWVIPVNGEAVEVLSWRQGAVRTLKVLPSPTTSSSAVDIYSLKRPIIALCDSAGPGPQFCSVTFISLKTGEQVYDLLELILLQMFLSCVIDCRDRYLEHLVIFSFID